MVVSHSPNDRTNRHEWLAYHSNHRQRERSDGLSSREEAVHHIVSSSNPSKQSPTEPNLRIQLLRESIQTYALLRNILILQEQ
jgi:hypothetical protein